MELVAAIGDCLGDNLEGVYLHGSLAMGCFYEGSSDVNLLVAIERPLAPAQRLCLRDLLLTRSGRPYLDYSEDWRPAMAAEAAGGALAPLPATDPDLAAHVAMRHHRGRVLVGRPIGAAFPAVPREAFLDAVFTPDPGATLATLRQEPVDGILNLCRLGLYARTGRYGSKREGALWALAEPEAPGCLSVARALAAYEAGRGQASGTGPNSGDSQRSGRGPSAAGCTKARRARAPCLAHRQGARRSRASRRSPACPWRRSAAASRCPGPWHGR